MVGSEAKRVALVVEEDKPFDPVKVSLFGANAVMSNTDEVTDLIEEFRHGILPKLKR